MSSNLIGITYTAYSVDHGTEKGVFFKTYNPETQVLGSRIQINDASENKQ